MNGRGNLRTALCVILLAVAALSAGCGRDVSLEDDQATSARLGRSAAGGLGKADPCILLSRSDAQAVLGGDVEGPTALDKKSQIGPGLLAGMGVCAFGTKGAAALPSFVLAGLTTGNATGAFDRYLDFNRPFGLEEVPDLGTEAVWDEKLGTLLVRVGPKRVLGIALVVGGRPAGRDDRQRATWLARSALARL